MVEEMLNLKIRIMILVLATTSSLTWRQVAAQDEELQPNYIGDEGEPPLPPKTILDGKVVELDGLNHVIKLRRSQATLNCAEGRMDIIMDFNEPFNGVVYPNNTHNSPCQVNGDGTRQLSMHIQLHGCGTRQGPERVFTNNIHIRFHPPIHYQYDEVVTVVCRYPPPIAPLPATNLRFIKPSPPPAPITKLPVLTGTNIIVIICAILFLSLLLLGLGFGYACMKRRRVSLIRKVPPPGLAPPSDITQLEMPFDGLKIPRAHAVPFMDDVTSSETIPSDYPSESMSELEDVDAGPVVVAGGIPNRSYLLTEHLLNTTFTDKTIHEEIDIHRQPHLMVEPKPVQQTLHSSEQLMARTLIDRQVEDSMEVRRGGATFGQHQAEVHTNAAAAFFVLPPPSARSVTDTTSGSDTGDGVVIPADLYASVQRGSAQRRSVDDLLCSTVTQTKICEDVEQYRKAVKEYYARKQQPVPAHWDVRIRQYLEEKDRDESSSSHWDESSIGTDVPPLPRLKTPLLSMPSVMGGEASEWLSSRTDESSRQTRDFRSQHHSSITTENRRYGVDSHENVNRVEESIRPVTRDFTPPKRAPPAMDVLIRILDAPHQYDESLSVLTEDDRTTLRELVTHEETFRNMLSSARVVEDFERIRSDSRFSRLLSDQKWDVIFRVMIPPLLEPAPSEFSDTTRQSSAGADYTDCVDNQVDFRMIRSRRYLDNAALPPVYEHDDIGGNMRQTRSAAGSTRSLLTTRSSHRGDVRSMTEETVNFHRYPPSVDEDGPSGQEEGPSRLVTSRFDMLQQWHTLPTPASASNADGGGILRPPAAPSTVGDREELYSMAETDVDWQRR